jgi:acetylcholinesterase
MLNKGDYKICPILLGVNKDEGAYFNIYVPYGNMTHHSWPYVDYNTFQTAIREYFKYIPIYPIESSSIILDSILQKYTVWNDYNNTVYNAIQLSFAIGDYHLTCPTIFIADIYAKQNIPVYFYQFALRASTSPWHQWMGVLHGNISIINSIYIYLFI